MQSLLNVRMDSTLKERGDKVLSDNGISVSDAVRALWAELAKTRAIPDFIKHSEEDIARKTAKKKALENLIQIGKKADPVMRETLASQNDESLRATQYDKMWEEYEALS